MKITRAVPNGPGMTASVPFATGERGENQPFFETMAERRAFHVAWMSEDDTQALIAALPPCPASTAWTDAMNEVLALTAADDVRPFDEVVADTQLERDALLALETLAESLRENSVLLGPVADMIERCPLGAVGTCDVNELQGWLSAVTGEQFQTGMPSDGFCDRHAEYCYHDSMAQSVPWEHIRLLAPGTRSLIADLAGILTATMPPVGVNDNGATRGRRVTA